MTKQQALAALGLTVLPADGKALFAAFAKANRASAMRLQYEPAHRDKTLHDMKMQKEAHDLLLPLVPTQPSRPVPPKPVPPRPVPPKPVPPRPAPPKPSPIPQPHTDWWTVLHRAISVAASSMADLLRAVQLVTQTIGVPAWRATQSIYRSMPPAARGCIVCSAVAVGSVWGGWHWFAAGTAHIRPLTWPVADVYVDGQYIIEGPSPLYAPVPSGFRKVRVVSRTGEAYETSFLFMPGSRYELQMNLRERTAEKRKGRDL